MLRLPHAVRRMSSIHLATPARLLTNSSTTSKAPTSSPVAATGATPASVAPSFTFPCRLNSISDLGVLGLRHMLSLTATASALPLLPTAADAAAASALARSLSLPLHLAPATRAAAPLRPLAPLSGVTALLLLPPRSSLPLARASLPVKALERAGAAVALCSVPALAAAAGAREAETVALLQTLRNTVTYNTSSTSTAAAAASATATAAAAAAIPASFITRVGDGDAAAAVELSERVFPLSPAAATAPGSAFGPPLPPQPHPQSTTQSQSHSASSAAAESSSSPDSSDEYVCVPRPQFPAQWLRHSDANTALADAGLSTQGSDLRTPEDWLAAFAAASAAASPRVTQLALAAYYVCAWLPQSPANSGNTSSSSRSQLDALESAVATVTAANNELSVSDALAAASAALLAGLPSAAAGATNDPIAGTAANAVAATLGPSAASAVRLRTLMLPGKATLTPPKFLASGDGAALSAGAIRELTVGSTGSEAGALALLQLRRPAVTVTVEGPVSAAAVASGAPAPAAGSAAAHALAAGVVGGCEWVTAVAAVTDALAGVAAPPPATLESAAGAQAQGASKGGNLLSNISGITYTPAPSDVANSGDDAKNARASDAAADLSSASNTKTLSPHDVYVLTQAIVRALPSFRSAALAPALLRARAAVTAAQAEAMSQPKASRAKKTVVAAALKTKKLGPGSLADLAVGHAGASAGADVMRLKRPLWQWYVAANGAPVSPPGLFTHVNSSESDCGGQSAVYAHPSTATSPLLSAVTHYSSESAANGTSAGAATVGDTSDNTVGVAAFPLASPFSSPVAVLGLLSACERVSESQEQQQHQKQQQQQQQAQQGKKASAPEPSQPRSMMLSLASKIGVVAARPSALLLDLIRAARMLGCNLSYALPRRGGAWGARIDAAVASTPALADYKHADKQTTTAAASSQSQSPLLRQPTVIQSPEDMQRAADALQKTRENDERAAAAAAAAANARAGAAVGAGAGAGGLSGPYTADVRVLEFSDHPYLATVGADVVVTDTVVPHFAAHAPPASPAAAAAAAAVASGSSADSQSATHAVPVGAALPAAAARYELDVEMLATAAPHARLAHCTGSPLRAWLAPAAAVAMSADDARCVWAAQAAGEAAALVALCAAATGREREVYAAAQQQQQQQQQQQLQR